MLSTSQNRELTMDAKTIKAIENVLAKGDRVELIPIKDGVKVVKVRRETVSAIGTSTKLSQRKSEVLRPTEFKLGHGDKPPYRAKIQIKENGQSTAAIVLEHEVDVRGKIRVFKELYADVAITDTDDTFISVIQTNEDGKISEYKAYIAGDYQNHLIEV